MQTTNYSHIAWATLLLLWACQEPSTPIKPIPSTLPSQSPLPSQKPTATPEPSNTPQPQPTPVQKVEVVDITPPEFVQAGGKFLTLAVDDDPTDPTVFVEYSGSDSLEAGIWKFKAGQQPQIVLPASDLRKLSPSIEHYMSYFLDMKYHGKSLYLLTPDENKVCFKKILVDSSLSNTSKPVPCLPYYQQPGTPMALALNQTGDIFTLRMKDSSVYSASFHFLKVTPDKTQTLFLSSPIGPDKKLDFFRSRVPDYGGSGFIGVSQGIHHGWVMDWSNNERKWVDPTTNISYILGNLNNSSLVHIQPPSGLSPKDLPSDSPKTIPLISDGPADKATFWLPFLSSYLDVDRHQNLYLRDRAGTEEYIRKITPEGYTTTLVSTSDKDSMYHFKTGEVNILAKTGEKEEHLHPFVIDQQRGYMYILGYNLYRLDLESNKLNIMHKSIGTTDNMRVGGDGNLYLQSYGLKITKVLIPQTDKR